MATSLDHPDWEETRKLWYRIVDDVVEALRQRPHEAVWRPVPAAVKAELAEGVPRDGAGLDATWLQARRAILPYATSELHPRFWGWVPGSGSLAGMIGEMVAAVVNSHGGNPREQTPAYVEQQIVAWCKTLFGFPEDASGLLVSGTSMATLVGLAIARHVYTEGRVRRSGLGALGVRLVGYASSEVHTTVARALEILGLGSDALHLVDVDDNDRIRLDLLRERIREDRRAGLMPFFIIGNAGTLSTGAIDELDALADIAAAEGLWLHVDGAFGAAAILSATLRPLLNGIERADSLAFDFHKWLQVPFAAGCVLVRDSAAHLATFSSALSALEPRRPGLTTGRPGYGEYGPEVTRGFRALKVWFTFKSYGLDAIAAKIEENCRQAHAFAGAIRRHGHLELMAPVSLNIVCFRAFHLALTPEAHDRLNAETVADLHVEGVGVVSTTRRKGRLAARACMTNPRTTAQDIEQFTSSFATAALSRMAEEGVRLAGDPGNGEPRLRPKPRGGRGSPSGR